MLFVAYTIKLLISSSPAYKFWLTLSFVNSKAAEEAVLRFFATYVSSRKKAVASDSKNSNDFRTNLL